MLVVWLMMLVHVMEVIIMWMDMIFCVMLFIVKCHLHDLLESFDETRLQLDCTFLMSV